MSQKLTLNGGSADSQTPGPSEPVPWFSVGLLFMAHFTVDSQVSFLSPLIREKFDIPLGTAGVLVYLLMMFNAGRQPVTAILVDRWPRPGLLSG